MRIGQSLDLPPDAAQCSHDVRIRMTGIGVFGIRLGRRKLGRSERKAGALLVVFQPKIARQISFFFMFGGRRKNRLKCRLLRRKKYYFRTARFSRRIIGNCLVRIFSFFSQSGFKLNVARWRIALFQLHGKS